MELWNITSRSQCGRIAAYFARNIPQPPLPSSWADENWRYWDSFPDAKCRDLVPLAWLFRSTRALKTALQKGTKTGVTSITDLTGFSSPHPPASPYPLQMAKGSPCKVAFTTCQFSQACAVLSPASLQILLRRSHARNNASASGDNTTDNCSPVASKEKSSRREKTARGLDGPSLGSNHGRRLG